MRKLTANYVFTNQGLEKNVIITIDNTGVITKIDRNCKDTDTIANLEFYSGILMPGMVNCHSHIEYSYVKGMITRHAGLPEFIRSIIDIKIKNLIPDSEKAEAARIWDNILYNHGVTAIADHNNNDYVYDLKRKSNIYYHNLVELFDVDNQDADTTFHEGMKRVETSNGYGLKASVIPHACYTMEDRLIGLTGGEIASNKGIKATGVLSVHFKESVVLGGEDETERTIKNISNERDSIIFVHCIYASQSDIDRAVEKFGSRLTLALCPLSNHFIEKRMGDLNMFIKKGVRIALGTDSLSSNDLLSMVDEMKCVQENYPNIPLEDILKMATINGAESLKIESWAGTIEEGKKPGIVLLEDADLNNMKLTQGSTTKRVI